MASGDRNDDVRIEGRADARQFETTQRLDPDAFEHAHSRVDGGFEWGVEALLTDERGRVLLVCEDGRWALPGGELSPEQSPEQALRGAVEDGTGLDIDVGELLAINEVTLTDGEREASLSFAIYGGAIAGPGTEPEPSRASISAVEWHAELPPATIDRQLLTELRE